MYSNTGFARYHILPRTFAHCIFSLLFSCLLFFFVFICVYVLYCCHELVNKDLYKTSLRDKISTHSETLSVSVKVVPDDDGSSPTSSQPDSGPDVTRPTAAGDSSPRPDHVEVEATAARRQRANPTPVYTEVIPSKMRTKASPVDHAAAEPTPHPTNDDGNCAEEEDSSTNARRSIPTYENVQLRDTVAVSTPGLPPGPY